MRQKDECRLWLESYKELRTEANRLWLRHERLRAQATRMTAQISLAPGGGSADKEKILAALADADEEAFVKYSQAVERMHEIETFIDSLPTRESRIILRHRYIELLRWPQVKRTLERSGIYYGDAQIFRLHGIALKEAREAWNKREETNNA